MQYKKIILVVESDQTESELLKTLLMSKDYKVVCASSGSEALRLRRNHNPDLILLELVLPDMDGFDVLREVRGQSQTPVIVVSAVTEEHIKVEALDCGAADYIAKPFGGAELLARVRNTIHLYGRLTSAPYAEPDVYERGGLTVDYAAYRVAVDSKPVHLTPIEYRIVELLSRNAGKVLTHEQIINKIWGPNNCDIQVLRVNMANIRRKFERGNSAQIITTELGVGYRIGGTDI